MTGVRELWWLPHVDAGYEISGKPYPRGPTPKYGIIHMKLAEASVVVFLINVYFVIGNHYYWHL